MCRFNSPDSAKFCSECGAPLKRTSAAFGSSTADIPPKSLRRSTDEIEVLLQRFPDEPGEGRKSLDTLSAEHDVRAADRFAKTMKAARVALWEWDLAKGVLTFLNNYETRYGISGPFGPLSSEEAMALVHPGDRVAATTAIGKTIETGEDCYCELRGSATNKDGSERWFACHGRYEFDRDRIPRSIVGVSWEITDRIRVEQALRSSEAKMHRLSMVACLTHNSAMLTDSAGRIEWINDAFTRLTGYGLDDVRGRTPGSLLYGPETDPNTQVQMREAVRKGEGFEFDILKYHKSGSTFWVSIEARPICDDEGIVTHYMRLETDISERKRVERSLRQLNKELERRVELRTRELATLNRDLVVQISERERIESSLRESEQRFREIAETIHEVFWIATPAFDRIHYVSPSYSRVWGRSWEQLHLAPRTLLESVHPDDAEVVTAMLERRRQGLLIDHEYRIVHAEGTIRWIWNRGFPIRDERGEMSRYIDVALDITDRKAIEDDLRTHSQVLLSMSEAVSFVDASGIIRFTNPAFDAMFGYEPGELVGRHAWLRNAASPEENHRIMSEVMKTMATKRVWAGEFRNVKKDGTVFWTSTHISQVVGDGAIRFVSIKHDITERTRSDEQRAMLTAQLAHASRLGTLGEMSAGLAHELNQPLAAICLYASAAQDIGASLRAPQLTECLSQIDEQSRRAGEIIRRMRSFASRHPFRREAADINELLREVLAILDNELKHSCVITDLRLAGDLPTISVDRIQIQQVAVNLIRNAIEAMAESGSGARRLIVRSEVDGGLVRVSITDNGEGISTAIGETLFAPFRSTKTSGLGLGLAICRTLVEAHGGSIDVKSETPSGTTFYFSLPLFSGAPTANIALSENSES